MLGLVARYPWVAFGLSFVELELDLHFVMREAGMRGVDSERCVSR
jgi:hypothetical protein